MSCNSESDGFWPRERMISPSSWAVMVPVHHESVRDIYEPRRLLKLSERVSFWKSNGKAEMVTF